MRHTITLAALWLAMGYGPAKGATIVYADPANNDYRVTAVNSAARLGKLYDFTLWYDTAFDDVVGDPVEAGREGWPMSLARYSINAEMILRTGNITTRQLLRPTAVEDGPSPEFRTVQYSYFGNDFDTEFVSLNRFEWGDSINTVTTPPARAAWITFVESGTILLGDSNRDGLFDSNDLVEVLAAGRYEDGFNQNALWEQGDWDGDFDFQTSDLILALSTGQYEANSAHPTPEPTGWLLTAFGLMGGWMGLRCIK